MKKSIHTLMILFITGAILSGLPGYIKGAYAHTTSNVNVLAATLPEADDFATTYFGDAWDMDDYSDISQHLNGGGRVISLANTQVQDGIFSARTTLDANNGGPSMFYSLFPGYDDAINLGKNIGELHPVNPNEYDCLYIALKVKSPDFDPHSSTPPDHFLVGWDADQTIPIQNVPAGNTFTFLYPETVTGAPVVHNWKLYKVDLGDPPNGLYSGSTPWKNYPAWQGVRIHPSIFKDIDFSVDWIRLTSCQDTPNHQANITWSPNPNISSVWVRSEGTNRNILVETEVNGISGNYLLDTKGLPPGQYQVGLGTEENCCVQWSDQNLTINKTPTVDFISPNPANGADYSTMGGNAWDIQPDDVNQIVCTDARFSGGSVFLDTLYPSAVPPNCRGGGMSETDSGMYLNLPSPLVDPRQYRYFNISHAINGEYSLPADGMIGRFLWTTTDGCTYVSRHFIYDVGKREYTIDLYEDFYGIPVESAPASCGLKHWAESGEITHFRFDPNENWTGHIVPTMIFHQEIDWIRLTKVDQVAAGSTYNIRIQTNKPSQEIVSANFFYTTNLAMPTMHTARMLQKELEPSLPGGLQLFLPLVALNSQDQPSNPPPGENEIIFGWDTTGVTPGEYYVCTTVRDSFNQMTDCSDAPVQIITQ